ncbi:MAG: YggS family pyridoxal phosphate-dependent enzyme [Alphaproteobacteria bacterium]|nr:YggS family pyridoxal phosphate-dependent enzyme [Alphaproteobacteria bacterium]
MSDVADNLGQLRARIAGAAKAADRPADVVTLVAVSKTHGPERIGEAIAAGQRVFGENRVQEAKAKWPALRAQHPDIAVHLIGPLQTNKVREAVALFDAIQSVDRPRLAEALAAEMTRAGRHLPCFVQVNTGEETQKAGVAPADTDALVEHCRGLGLAVTGLMCIPPLDDQPAPHFALLAKIAQRTGLEHLSMGMSADFEAAIRLGATHVRLGSAVFGHRGSWKEQ